MQEETRRRLDRLHWRQLSDWLPALLVLMLLLTGFFAYHLSAREEHKVAGTVESAQWLLNSDTGQFYPHIEVKLDSGASVRVGSLTPALPAVGDRITLRQRALLFNYVTAYEWDGPRGLEAHPAPVRVSLP